jgi:hypothetical protein
MKMLRILQKFGRIELPVTTSWVVVGEGQMEGDCGGGQGLTKGCRAKGIIIIIIIITTTTTTTTTTIIGEAYTL